MCVSVLSACAMLPKGEPRAVQLGLLEHTSGMELPQAPLQGCETCGGVCERGSVEMGIPLTWFTGVACLLQDFKWIPKHTH